MKTKMMKPEEVVRKWYVVDATDLVLGRLASQVAAVLRGKNKPCFTPNVDTGDHVIVINCDKVRLTGRGTDLTFSIKGIPAVPCAGENNIPDGEIFTAPVRDSVNGVITYNTTAYYEGVAFENICFKFKDGRIVEATSSDTERLNQILDRDEGNRYIGEFAIGVNPYVTTPMKDTMFSEKMSGSIHFTPGECIPEADNGNHAPMHWDIVFIQTPECGGGDIYFDDVLIRKDGRFVLPELFCLNPENLK